MTTSLTIIAPPEMVSAVFVRENAPDSAGRTGDEQQLEQEYYAHLAPFVNKIFYDDACGDGAVRTQCRSMSSDNLA